ncbi:hypothetical protein FOA52_016038 [Chlamydomonas sp. UWO 241]|nr:hypothetical protein FOA52_016038 [Chlamydomonas sp. UWO 241]
MRCALSAKAGEGRLVVVDSLASMPGQAGTVPVRQLSPLLRGLATLSASGTTTLFVDCGETDPQGGRPLRTAAAVVPGVAVLSTEQLTVYHSLRYHVLVITARALRQLEHGLVDHPRHRMRAPLRAAWWRREVEAFDKSAAELGAAADKAAAALGAAQ